MKPLKQLMHRLLNACGIKVMKYSAYTDLISDMQKRFDFLTEKIVSSTLFLKRDVPAWYLPNASEPGVQLILRDLIKPGDTCLDVGAFQGDLTLMMSRLVGPKGQIVTFEANPLILERLTNNCISNFLTNVFLIHGAVWHKSDEWLQFFNNGAASRIDIKSTEKIEDLFRVKSISLDDFLASNKMIPDVVKMDIEGAEKHALRGFANNLELHKPHLIFEHATNDGDDALVIIKSHGYRTFCSNQYQEVHTSADFLKGSGIRNVVCIHESKIGSTGFANPLSLIEKTKFELSDFEKVSESVYSVKANLDAGRYIALLELSAPADATISYQIATERGVQGQYYEQFCRFEPSCRDLPFDLSEPQTVKINLETVERDFASTIQTCSIQIFRVDGYPVS
ncbi:MAG: FkbM family methyltransferase, partial [Planctomycetia bacterium]|nr:FkbM family methyltransferase [Planctomycetia bacterium]